MSTAKTAWNGLMPEWLIVLATKCDSTSQAKTAKRIGFSPAVVSLVLKNKYCGNLNNVEKAVRLAFMPGTVVCPILGEISEADCVRHQSQPFAATSSMSVRLYKACRQCEHNETQED
jgi:hypothetical protein